MTSGGVKRRGSVRPTRGALVGDWLAHGQMPDLAALPDYNPFNLLRERMSGSAYTWHNYGRSVIGTLSDIENVPIERLQALTRHAIAVDASCTHMYSPGVKRHIAKALDLGATPEEIMAVLQLVAVLGIHSVALGTPHLVDEMKARGMPVPTNPASTED